jgi:hypothetical protein
MAKQETESYSTIATLELSFIDLRAHFEAQLRTVARAERCLVNCRSASDERTFATAVDSLQAEIQVVSTNNCSIRAVIDQVDTSARRLAPPTERSTDLTT